MVAGDPIPQRFSSGDISLKMPNLPFTIIRRKDLRPRRSLTFLRDRAYWFDKAGMLPSLVEALGICFFLSRLFEIMLIMRPPLFWKQPPVLPSGQKPHACYPYQPELAGRSVD